MQLSKIRWYLQHVNEVTARTEKEGVGKEGSVYVCVWEREGGEGVKKKGGGDPKDFAAVL